MISLYAILNLNAKTWWHFRDLRKSGKVSQARKLERQSIRSSVKHFRQGFVLSIGNYGMTLYCANKHGAESYTLTGGNVDFYFEVCKRLSIPIVDSRDLDFDIVCKKVSIPSPTFWTVKEYLKQNKEIGVKVYE
jgi:hypothetical protein